MKIHYWNDNLKCPKGNFGDELNLWIWPKLIPDIAESKDDGLLVGIGTVINDSLFSTSHKVAIFGSGVGYGQTPKINESWRIYCLRGPRTASALQVNPELAVTDAALLVRSCYSSNNSNQDLEKSILFMPHWQTPRFLWERACQQIGFTYVDPSDAIEDILLKISQAKFVITEAMHGAIVADALRVPWIPISTRPSINTFKWLDWCDSMQIEYKPVNLYWKRFTVNSISQENPLTSLALILATQGLNWIANSVTPKLSEEKVLIQKEKLLHQKLDEFRLDWQNGLFN